MMKIILLIYIYFILMILIISMIINSMNLNNKFIHPTSMGTFLILFSMILSLNLSTFYLNHWFSFIMFLTISSGMMILFMYFISFINNMKMMLMMNLTNSMIISTMMFMLLFFLMFNFFMKMKFMWFNFNETNSLMNLMNNNLTKNFMKINFMYNYNKNISTIISMIYLFFCLTMIVKMCMMNKYSLRKIN